jgi:hypothetical protein
LCAFPSIAFTSTTPKGHAVWQYPLELRVAADHEQVRHAAIVDELEAPLLNQRDHTIGRRIRTHRVASEVSRTEFGTPLPARRAPKPLTKFHARSKSRTSAICARSSRFSPYIFAPSPAAILAIQDPGVR